MTSCITLTNDAGIATLTLNRPQFKNAFNDELLRELDASLQLVATESTTRVLIITGAGDAFSAGADLNWMRDIAAAGEARNRDDALAMAAVMRRLAFLPLPTIARVNGPAFGGGVGLIACCDIAVGSDGASFGLTEARLGLVPAVISPYVIASIGARHAGRLFMSAQRFSANQALAMNLLHRVVAPRDLDDAVAEEVRHIMRCGPLASRAAKSLVAAVAGRTEDAQKTLDGATANLIASLRMSPEGREGIDAFLEKRPADWIKDS